MRSTIADKLFRGLNEEDLYARPLRRRPFIQFGDKLLRLSMRLIQFADKLLRRLNEDLLARSLQKMPQLGQSDTFVTLTQEYHIDDNHGASDILY